MRLKAARIIIIIAFAITAANFCVSLMLTRQSLTETVGKDISLALDIANDLVSTRIQLYEFNAQTVAERLAHANSADEMEEIMRDQFAEFPDFLSYAVYDRQGVVAECGDLLPAESNINENKYIQIAFDGKTVISTTLYNEMAGKLVMYICTPMDAERILSVTIPGLIFSELLENYVLWNSGNIFMIDGEGVVIAYFLPDTVISRTNITNKSGSSGAQPTTEFWNEMLSGKKGQGIFSYDGIEYQCDYARVSASKPGWYIGLAIPLSESPVILMQNRLMIITAAFFAVSVIAAIISSGYIVKPYNKIAEQKRQFEELNEITRTQAEQIQESHQRTMLMMDAMPLCAMLWDSHGKIFDCNEECVKLFQMKDKQDFLDNFFSLSPEYGLDGRLSQEMVMNHVNLVFENGCNKFEWLHQLIDGTPIPCEMTLVRVSYDGEYIVAAYARDLREHNGMMEETLRLQNELEAALKEAQEANQAKSNFLASMSHEMRTPLNAVIGLSELLLNSRELHKESTEKLDKIYISGMMLLGIVNDILDISKIESGKFEMHPADYDTPSLINDIISLNIMRIGEKPIQFILKVDEDLPGLLFGDELRVKQIFNNLLSNAFKYTDSGTVEWTVSYERDGDDVWLISYVKDTGIGIKHSDIPRLFLDYSQVDSQTNRKAEGTGLGLAIAKRLAEMMSGTITVTSEYGKGTTFFVRLCQRLIPGEPIGKETAGNLMSDRFTTTKRNRSASLARIDLSYARVLVVDDMPTNLDVAKGMLAPYGITVDCAINGPQAIEMIRNGNPRYDAVFMDHMMPGMDGVEATRIIREEIGTEYARELPVIALTANAIAGNEKMFLSRGFQAFISKPIDMMRLDSVLRQWVRRKDGERKRDANEDNKTADSNLLLDYVTDDGVTIGDVANDGITIDGVTIGDVANDGITIDGVTIDDVANDGITIDGETIGDVTIGDVTIDGVTIDGVTIDDVTIDGITIDGITIDGITIDGMDIDAGLARFGYNEETYIHVLKSYAVNTRALLEKLEEYLASGNLNDYAITVHGIKGSSFALCAQKAGQLAGQLENLANDGETEQVMAKNNEFTAYLKDLLDLIDSALDEYNSKNKKQTLSTPEPSLLQELRVACMKYDAGRVDKVMTQLDAFDYETGTELIAWLHRQVDETNYAVIACGDWPHNI